MIGPTDGDAWANGLECFAVEEVPDAPIELDSQTLSEIGLRARARSGFDESESGNFDLPAMALTLGILEWLAGDRSRPIYLPCYDEAEWQFAQSLLQQMAVCSGDSLFALLQRLVVVGWNSSPDIITAFAAGVVVQRDALNRDGESTAQTVRSSVARHALNVELLRAHTKRRKAAAAQRRSMLLPFARDIVAADPFTSDAAIARAFREQHRPRAAENTDLEERDLRTFRRTGALPPRRLRKVARLS